MPEAGAAATDLPGVMRRAGFEVLPVTLEHAVAAGALPGPHLDPFDRMLVAQAKLEAIRIATDDPVFGSYGVAVLW